LLGATLAVIVAVALPARVARAEPDPKDVEAAIDSLWRQAEPMIEQYDLVHEQYEQNLAQQKVLQARIQPLADKLAAAQERIGRVSARAYMGGQATTFNALLSGAADSDFISEMVVLEGMASTQTTQLSDVLELKAEYDEQKAPIDALVARLAAQNDDLSAQRAQIETRLDQLQDLRTDAYVDSEGTTSIRPWVCPTKYEPTDGYKAAAFACAQIGKAYVFGAAGPKTYDCSGLTMRAWQQVGVYLPHNAAAQRRSMPYIKQSQLQIGDLVFYHSDLSHVAIYVGDGKVVHVPHTGDVVRMVPMIRPYAPIHSYGHP
jgi:cell wall-associated NlpC family hydrolase